MRNSILKTAGWVAMGIAVLLISACGQDGSSFGTSTGISSHAATENTTGTLQVALTDAVDPSLKEVVISIKEVQLIPKAQGTKGDVGLSLATFDPPHVVNVLDLAYQQEILGEAQVPAGTYNQMRLILEENRKGELPANYVRFEDDSIAALTIPSSQTSGLKISGKFTVPPNEKTSIVFDFDPAKAIYMAGKNKWMFKPTGIRICGVETVLPQYGAITGSVMSGETVVADAIVSVIPLGQVEPIATSPVNPEDGSFRALLPAGIYYLKIDAEGFEPFTSDPETFGVNVGYDTDAGIIHLKGLAPPDGAITGSVMSGETVVANAIVSVIPLGQVEPIATSPVIPEDGSFRISLPPGTYYLEVDAEGYEHATSSPSTFDVVSGQDADAGIINLTGLVLEYGAIYGYVLSGENLVPGAIVSVLAVGRAQAVATGPVNADEGLFRIPLPVGSYYLEVDADGYEHYTSGTKTFNVTVDQETWGGFINLKKSPSL